MNTRLIFDQEGIQVYETNNRDARSKEWHISKGKIGFSVGFMPILSKDWLSEYISQYLKDKSQEEHEPSKDMLK